MNTSLEKSELSKPVGDERIPRGTLEYLRVLNQSLLHDLIIEIFEASGISQATLARRMGQSTARICRLLASPGNWTTNTFSDLLFAINGATPRYEVDYPLDAPAVNASVADWIYEGRGISGGRGDLSWIERTEPRAEQQGTSARLYIEPQQSSAQGSQGQTVSLSP